MSTGGVSHAPDPKLARLARQSRNFGFLLPHMPLLVAYGSAAETHVFDDPNTSLIKSRQFGEALASDLVSRGRVRVDGAAQFDRLKSLDREGYLHGDVGTAFHEVRTLGNDANHKGHDSADDAFRALRSCFRLGVWYHRLLTGSREQITFVPPDPSATPAADDQHLMEAVATARKALEEARLSYQDKTSQAQAELAARTAAERELAAAKAEREELARQVAAMQDQLKQYESAFDAKRAQKQRADATSSAAASAAVAERAQLLDNAEQAAASHSPKSRSAPTSTRCSPVPAGTFRTPVQARTCTSRGTGVAAASPSVR